MFEGCTELPATAVGINELGAGIDAMRGLEIGGLIAEPMPVNGLGAPGKVIPGLLAGNGCDMGRAEDPEMPNLLAIICALSWKSFCFDLSNCSLTLTKVLSISPKKANLVSSL